MSGTVLAHVRRIATSPEGRALVHAVGDNGFEFKIEVPLEAVRGAGDAGEQVLLLAWSLHALPPDLRPPAPTEPATAAPAPTTPAAGSARPAPSAVDQQFMALMSRGASTPPPSAAPATSPGTDPAARPGEQLAVLLGIGRAPT